MSSWAALVYIVADERANTGDSLDEAAQADSRNSWRRPVLLTFQSLPRLITKVHLAFGGN